jgi:hypothetical protein
VVEVAGYMDSAPTIGAYMSGSDEGTGAYMNGVADEAMEGVEY